MRGLVLRVPSPSMSLAMDGRGCSRSGLGGASRPSPGSGAALLPGASSAVLGRGGRRAAAAAPGTASGGTSPDGLHSMRRVEGSGLGAQGCGVQQGAGRPEEALGAGPASMTSAECWAAQAEAWRGADHAQAATASRDQRAGALIVLRMCSMYSTGTANQGGSWVGSMGQPTTATSKWTPFADQWQGLQKQGEMHAAHLRDLPDDVFLMSDRGLRGGREAVREVSGDARDPAG